MLAEKGVAFKVVDDPTIDTTSRTGKLVMGILSLIAEFENDIRRERQMDGITKAKRSVVFILDASARSRMIVSKKSKHSGWEERRFPTLCGTWGYRRLRFIAR